MKSRVNPLLALALVICALFLVNAQHQSRRLFIELEREQIHTRKLEVEGRQLQLEQSRLSQHGRIEAVAKQDLKMMTVKTDQIIYLTPGGQ
jgi:cell division protein FtsL